MASTTSEPTRESTTINKRIDRQGIQYFGRIFGYVFRYKAAFIIGSLFLLLSTGTTLVFPYLGSMLADAAQGKATLSVNTIGILLLSVLLLQGLFSYMRVVIFAYVTEKSMADLRTDLYAKLITLPISFFEQHRVGELSSRITSDISQLQNAFAINMAELLRQVATLVVGVIIIAFTSLHLTALMLCTVPVAVVVAIFLGKKIRSLSRDSQDALAAANVVAEETMQSVQVVKAFTNEKYETQRYGQAMSEAVKLALKAARFRGAFVTFLISAVFGGIILVLWYGSVLVQNGDLTIGELLRFILYTFFIGAAIGGMGDLYSNLLKALGASERVADLLGEQSELSLQSAELPIAAKSDIHYQNIRFSYPTRPDLPVLKDISLHIKQGSKIALVGQSGAGKSTIVQLLLRFYKPDSGQILCGNNDITQFDISAWRASVGIVPQEVLLFGGTIRENIRYGKPTATDAEIEEAAQKANALDFIRLFPDGMETLVGERGVKLSGGQRQRIAIARAILKNPAVLILDEATSSLDAESEYWVQSALNVLMQDRTTIIIAHRLSTIRQVDCIYVLDGGQIVEQGSHETLAAKTGGYYQNLLKLQFDNK